MSASVAHLRVINDPAWVRAIFLASDGDLEGALALTPAPERALELGDESSLPSLLELLALIEFRAGNWQRADELIDTAFEIAVRADQEIQRLALVPGVPSSMRISAVRIGAAGAMRRSRRRWSVGCPFLRTWLAGR